MAGRKPIKRNKIIKRVKEYKKSYFLIELTLAQLFQLLASEGTIRDDKNDYKYLSKIMRDENL